MGDEKKQVNRTDGCAVSPVGKEGSTAHLTSRLASRTRAGAFVVENRKSPELGAQQKDGSMWNSSAISAGSSGNGGNTYTWTL